MAYSVSVDLGSGWENITSKLYGRYPVTRSRPIHARDNPFTPVVGSARFAIVRDVTLINRFLTSSGSIAVVITKDGSPYFAGQVRNTHKVSVGLMRAEGFAVECVDSWMRLEKRCSLSTTWSGYTVSNPTTKTTSILHQLFYAAGFSDAELDLSAVSVTRDRSVFDSADTATYREKVESILAEIGYTAYVDPSGIVHLYDMGPASITPSATLSSGAGGNIAEGYEIERIEARAEAVDVSYWPHETLTSQVVFEDTTGGSSASTCSIPISAGGYYPVGADSTHDVRGQYAIKDRELIAVDSPAIEWAPTGGAITKQVETTDGLAMRMRFYSAAGGTLTALRIKGSAIVKGNLNKVVRENVSNTEKRLAISCAWIYSQADAERLAIILANWHANARYLYTMRTTLLTLAPGDYVTLSETSIMGASQTLRVVSVEDGADPKTLNITCEGASAYSYSALPRTTQSATPPAGEVLLANVVEAIPSGANGYRLATRTVYQWSVSAPGTRPTGTARFTWATGAWSSVSESLGSWTPAPTSSVAGQTLWAIDLLASDNLTGATTDATWASQTIYAVGYGGTNGVAGEGVLTWTLTNITRSNNNQSFARTEALVNGWTNSLAYTSEKFGQATLGFVPARTGVYYMAGLSPEVGTPTYTGSYLWYINSAIVQYFGLETGYSAAAATTDSLQVTFDGKNVRFIRNGSVVHTSPDVAAGTKMKPAVFLYNADTTVSINNLAFAPTAMGWRPTWLTDFVVPSTVNGVLAKLVDAPTGAGMFYGESYMGYRDATAWRAYIDNNGYFLFGNAAGTRYLKWDGTTFEISGKINLVDAAGTPGSSGLYIASDKMGYYNAGWKTYMDSSGNFYLGGSSGGSLSWDAVNNLLTITGSLDLSTTGKFRGSGGKISITPTMPNNTPGYGFVLTNYDQGPIGGGGTVPAGALRESTIYNSGGSPAGILRKLEYSSAGTTFDSYPYGTYGIYTDATTTTWLVSLYQSDRQSSLSLLMVPQYTLWSLDAMHSASGNLNASISGYAYDVAAATYILLNLNSGSAGYQFAISAFYPTTSSTIDLGTSTYKWKDAYFFSTINVGTGTITQAKIQNWDSAYTNSHLNTEAGHSWHTYAVVTNKVLTGFAAANGSISATDSILSAFNKLAWDKHQHSSSYALTCSTLAATGNVNPGSNNTYNLGTNSLYWAKLWCYAKVPSATVFSSATTLGAIYTAMNTVVPNLYDSAIATGNIGACGVCFLQRTATTTITFYGASATAVYSLSCVSGSVTAQSNVAIAT